MPVRQSPVLSDWPQLRQSQPPNQQPIFCSLAPPFLSGCPIQEDGEGCSSLPIMSNHIRLTYQSQNRAEKRPYVLKHVYTVYRYWHRRRCFYAGTPTSRTAFGRTATPLSCSARPAQHPAAQRYLKFLAAAVAEAKFACVNVCEGFFPMARHQLLVFR